MAKNQLSNVGGKFGPGIVNNPGWSKDKGYANSTREDKAAAKVGANTREERASGTPANKQSDGLFETRQESKVISRGRALNPGGGETGLKTQNTFLR